MAETYTKPFESVQDAVILFEQRIDQTKNSIGSNKEEKEGEYLKDFTNCWLQLEAKEDDKGLAVFDFDGSQMSPEELLTWLKMYKSETDKYKEKFRRAQELFFEFEKGDESRIDALKQPEMMKRTIIEEKETELDLSMRTPEIKEVIFSSQRLPIDTDFFWSKKQLEFLTSQFDKMEDLEKELLKNVIIAEYLHIELKQSKDAQAVSSKSASRATEELDFVKSEAEMLKLICSARGNCIIELEEEGKRMKEELKISSEKMNGIDSQIEMFVNEIHRMQEEIFKSNNRELELQEKVTSLTSELRNSAETNAASNKALDFTGILISMEEYDFLLQKSEMADSIKSIPNEEHEISKLQRELEDKNAEISELTYRFEEALKRAEMAERAKSAVEEQLRVWREQKQLRRAVSEALKEYAAKNPEASRQHKKPWLHKRAFSIKPETHSIPSIPKRTVSMHDGRQSSSAPLGKFLKIKLRSSS